MTGTLLTDRGKEAIGDSKGQGGSTAAAALKIEDLLSIITNATISAQNYAPFWNQMNKRPAISNVVENTLLNDLGGVPGLGFLDPTTLTGGGADNDPDLARADQKMRWYGHDYSVQLPAALITAQGLNGAPAPGNVESTTSYAALNQLIIDLNYQAWHGNGTVNSLAANGFIQQVRAVHNLATGIIVRVNCGGKPLTQDHLSEAKAIMYANGSTPTDLWWSPNTLADVEKSLTPGQRYEPGKELDLLNIPENFLSMKLAGQITRVKSHRDMHLDPILKHAPTTAKGKSPVTKPSSVTAAVSTQASGNALDGGYLKKGDYYYSVAAAGIKGRSDARAVSGVTSTDGTEKVTLTITFADSNTKFFEIYRGPSSDLNTHEKIGEVAGVASGLTTTWVDDGEFLPGCATGAMINDMALPDGTSLFMARQLLPITRFALPIYAFNHPAIWMAGL